MTPSLSSSSDPFGQKLRFGLNYVPSRNWYYCWNEWEPDSVNRDFAAIRTLGADHIRVQVLWPYFQPNAGVVSRAHLKRLESLLRLAEENGLDVILCAVTGWLSGYAFLPPGVSGDDVFRSDAVFCRIREYCAALGEVCRGHANCLGIDLGNEINVLAMSRVPDALGDLFGRRCLEMLAEHFPAALLVNGTDHQPWFQGTTFSAEHLLRDYDAVCFHAWPLFTGCLERGGLADPHSIHLGAFLTDLGHSLLEQRGLHKPVWIQEFGCSSEWGSPSEQASYLEKSVVLAIEAGASCFTWWCSHDIDRAYKFDSLEYDLGLFTTGNEAKPLADVFRRLAAEYGGKPVRPPVKRLLPLLPRGFRPGMLSSYPAATGFERSLHTETGRLFRRYLDEGGLA